MDGTEVTSSVPRCRIKRAVVDLDQINPVTADNGLSTIGIHLYVRTAPLCWFDSSWVLDRTSRDPTLANCQVGSHS